LAAQPPVFAAGPAPSQEALRAAQARLMGDPSLQFSFDKAPKPPPPPHLPHWLDWIVPVLRVLGRFIAWIAQGLGWVFLAGLAVAVAMVLFFIGREIIRARWPDLLKKKPGKAKPAVVDWRPEAAAARALLEEADRLAAAGRYAEAARLLLHRSIEEIDGRRPRLVRPALTSREISGLEDIPEAARTTFAAIAGVVERSFFGGGDVDAAGFAECRRTYEAFAFPGAWA
jgi:hypothetical protein